MLTICGSAKMLFKSLGCVAGWRSFVGGEKQGRTFCAGEGYITTIVSMTLPSRRRGGPHIPMNKLVWTGISRSRMRQPPMKKPPGSGFGRF